MTVELDALRTKGVQYLGVIAAAAGAILLVIGLIEDAALLGLGALAILADWRMILAATVTTAAHQLLLNFVDPLYVFPDGANLLRVVFHAVVVVFEASVLVLLAMRIEGLSIGLNQAHEEQLAKDAQLSGERERVAAEQREVLDALEERLAALAKGNLAGRLTRPFPADYDQARQMLNATCTALEQLFGGMAINADRVANGSQELREAPGSLASKTEEHAAQIDPAAPTASDMLDTFEQQSQRWNDTRATALHAKAEADRGTTAIVGAAEAMELLHTANDRNGQVSSFTWSSTGAEPNPQYRRAA